MENNNAGIGPLDALADALPDKAKCEAVSAVVVQWILDELERRPATVCASGATDCLTLYFRSAEGMTFSAPVALRVFRLHCINEDEAYGDCSFTVTVKGKAYTTMDWSVPPGMVGVLADAVGKWVKERGLDYYVGSADKVAARMQETLRNLPEDVPASSPSKPPCRKADKRRLICDFSFLGTVLLANTYLFIRAPHPLEATRQIELLALSFLLHAVAVFLMYVNAMMYARRVEG
jgi:hypothetical protein